MPLDEVAEGDRHQPDRRVPLRAGGRPRHAEAAVGPHHQHRLDRRPARVGERPALRGVRREQGRPDGADARARRVVGAQGHPRQRDRARLLPLAAGRRRDRDERGRRSRRSARFRASATPASSRASRSSSPPTRPTTSPARRSSSTADGQSRDARHLRTPRGPWLRHYDYWVRPHLTYPGRPLERHPRAHGGRAARSAGDAVSRRAADLPRAEAAVRRARRRARASSASSRAIASASCCRTARSTSSRRSRSSGSAPSSSTSTRATPRARC